MASSLPRRPALTERPGSERCPTATREGSAVSQGVASGGGPGSTSWSCVVCSVSSWSVVVPWWRRGAAATPPSGRRGDQQQVLPDGGVMRPRRCQAVATAAVAGRRRRRRRRSDGLVTPAVSPGRVEQVEDVGPAPEVEGEGLPVGRHHHLGEPGHAGHVGRREGAVRGHRPGAQGSKRRTAAGRAFRSKASRVPSLSQPMVWYLGPSSRIGCGGSAVHREEGRRSIALHGGHPALVGGDRDAVPGVELRRDRTELAAPELELEILLRLVPPLPEEGHPLPVREEARGVRALESRSR